MLTIVLNYSTVIVDIPIDVCMYVIHIASVLINRPGNTVANPARGRSRNLSASRPSEHPTQDRGTVVLVFPFANIQSKDLLNHNAILQFYENIFFLESGTSVSHGFSPRLLVNVIMYLVHFAVTTAKVLQHLSGCIAIYSK